MNSDNKTMQSSENGINSNKNPNNSSGCRDFINLTLQQLKATLQLGIPLMFTQLLGYAQQIIDTVMAGQHSPLTLAAVALAGQIFALIFLFCIGISVAISASVSRYRGEKDIKRIRRSFQQGLWLMATLAIISFILFNIASYLPFWIGSAADIAQQAQYYLFAIAPGGAIYIFAFAMRTFLEGMAYPKTNIFIQLSLIPVNIFLNFAFLEGWWIFPAWGAMGLAVATSICYILYALIIFIAIYKNKLWQKYRLFSSFMPPNILQIKALLNIGLPVATATMMEASLFIAISLILSRGDKIIVAANQIALNYSGTVFMLPLGLSFALTVRIAYSNGSGKFNLLLPQACGGIIISLIIMSISATMIYFFSDYIVLFYTDDIQIKQVAIAILSIIALFQIADGIGTSASGVLRGLHDTKIIMYYAFISYWLFGFSLAILLAFKFSLDVYGLWLGLTCGLICNATLCTRRVWQKTRAANKIFAQ